MGIKNQLGIWATLRKLGAPLKQYWFCRQLDQGPRSVLILFLALLLGSMASASTRPAQTASNKKAALATVSAQPSGLRGLVTNSREELCAKVPNPDLRALCQEHQQNTRITRFCAETFGQRPAVTQAETDDFRRCFQLNFVIEHIPQVLERLGLCQRFAGDGMEAVRDCAIMFPDNYVQGLSCLESFKTIEDLRYCYTTPKALGIVFECLRLNVDPKLARHCIGRVTHLPLLHRCYRHFLTPNARQSCLDWQMTQELSAEELLLVMDQCGQNTKKNRHKNWEQNRLACLTLKARQVSAQKIEKSHHAALLDTGERENLNGSQSD